MLAIAKAESSFLPKAENPDSSATGLFQIIDGTFEYFECTGDRKDPVDNTICAMKIATDKEKGGGLHHWNESKENWQAQAK